MEDGGCPRGVGAECHALVVEFGAGMEFVDAGLQSGFPYLEPQFGGEVRELGESRRVALEGSFEGFGDCCGGSREGAGDGAEGKVNAVAGFYFRL